MTTKRAFDSESVHHLKWFAIEDGIKEFIENVFSTLPLNHSSTDREAE